MTPSVTEILSDVGIIDKTWFTPEACERGRAVHKICQLWDENDLDLDTVHPDYEGYFSAYQKFLAEAGNAGFPDTWTWIELPSQGDLYHGTMDRVAIGRPRFLLDIKTGSHQSWHALQLAAYASLLPDPFSYERVGLYLGAKGTYTVRFFPKADYASDYGIFISAMKLFYWRKSNGK